MRTCRLILFASCLVLTIAVSSPAQAPEKAEEQLLPTLSNTGFETPSIAAGAKEGDDPEKWFYFSSTPERNGGLSDARKKAGSQSAFLQAQQQIDAYEGLAQRFSAQPQTHYTFSVNVLKDPENSLTAGAFGQLSIEWQDEKGTEITRVYGPTWNANLSSSRWEKYTVEADSPDGVARGVVVVSFFSKDSNGFGRFFIDDVDLSSKPLSK